MRADEVLGCAAHGSYNGIPSARAPALSRSSKLASSMLSPCRRKNSNVAKCEEIEGTHRAREGLERARQRWRSKIDLRDPLDKVACLLTMRARKSARVYSIPNLVFEQTA